MMRLFPHHELEQLIIIHTFYNRLLYNTKMKLDAAASDALMDKPYEDAYQLIENMAQNHFQWGGANFYRKINYEDQNVQSQWHRPHQC